MCDQAEGEIEVLPGEHAYSINANYKFLCENSYDGYHLLPTHISYLEFLDERNKASRAKTARSSFMLNAVREARARARPGPRPRRRSSPGCRPDARWRNGSRPGALRSSAEIDATRARLEAQLRQGARRADRGRAEEHGDLPEPRHQRQRRISRCASSSPTEPDQHAGQRLGARAGQRVTEAAGAAARQLRELPRARRVSARRTTSRCSSCASAASNTPRSTGTSSRRA